ncbi:hypothetical protein NQV17_29645 [Burkholderia sp. SCN-KJ]|nr:hypothetical protein [Burkholderia sp. SCN-KJ]MCR4470424.1 hypothetical protein [Burkholderia sp. SCN-KJ]
MTGAIESIPTDFHGYYNGITAGLDAHRVDVGLDACIVGSVPSGNPLMALEMSPPIVEDGARRKTCDHRGCVAAIAAIDKLDDWLWYSRHILAR